MASNNTRRDFLKTAGIAGVGVWITGGISHAARKSPNETIDIACIGVGGKGVSDTRDAGKVGNVVAICDIDDSSLKAMTKEFPNAKKYHDFRKLFDEMGARIDAVTVSTPDHTHAVACARAMRMGKHVYCQKPLTHSVKEARTLRDLAEKTKVATQMGNQGTAHNGFRRAVELIQAGVIGPIREAHVWTDRPIWPQAPKITRRPKETPTCPTHVHWDLFLGPAPERPYHAAYHPFNWRGWWDFGTGALGDMACHTANMAFMALKLGYPTSVYAECGDLNSETYPSWATVTLEFPARGELVPVKFFWYEGQRDGKKNLPPEALFHGEAKIPGSGSLLVGNKGIGYSPDDNGTSIKFLGMQDASVEDFKSISQTLPRNGKGDLGMKLEWAAAINGGPLPMSNFGYGAALTETILLGNAAIRAGKKLDWDGPGMKFTNDSAANAYLHREYRKGWTL